MQIMNQIKALFIVRGGENIAKKGSNEEGVSSSEAKV